MAQQKSFGQDDQGKQNARNETALAPSKGVGTRSATFVGGDVDPVTGNIVPGSTQAASTGFTVTGSENPPPPPPPPPAEVPAPQPTPEPPRIQQVFAEPAPTYTAPAAPAAPAFFDSPAASSQPAATPIVREDKSNVVEQVGKWFCYGTGTLIMLANGAFRRVEALEIGDETMLGGKVLGVGSVLAETKRYRRTHVTPTHAVFEDGRFIRVGDSSHRSAATFLGGTVHPVVTEHHLMVTETHISADFAECEDGFEMTPRQRLEKMNAEHERLAWLAAQERRLFQHAAA